MAEYVPMVGPLPGQQYEPSNGTEGSYFIESWCSNCARDKEMNGTCHAEGRDPGDDDWCEILSASFRGEAVEWRELDSGECTCLAFVEAGSEPPPPRCAHTKDMFGSPFA
jgi:hypothetical protein